MFAEKFSSLPMGRYHAILIISLLSEESFKLRTPQVFVEKHIPSSKWKNYSHLQAIRAFIFTLRFYFVAGKRNSDFFVDPLLIKKHLKLTLHMYAYKYVGKSTPSSKREELFPFTSDLCSYFYDKKFCEAI